eukprot:9517179-Lingulodinium_polyedra.AAC.1
MPAGAKKLRLKFVCKHKPQADGGPPIFHARPCVTEFRGSTELTEAELYTPGIQQTSLKVLLSLFLHQLNTGKDYVCKATDIKRAFLKGDPAIAQQVWRGQVYVVNTPKVWHRDIVQPLLRPNLGVEGLQSAPKIFRLSAQEVFMKLGATYDDIDPCLFVIPHPDGMM